MEITEESFAAYRNLGGYDYIGRSQESLEASHFESLARSCKSNKITGLILVGATHTLTDATKLTEYFKKNNISVNVCVIPSTIDGNIRHKFF